VTPGVALRPRTQAPRAAARVSPTLYRLFESKDALIAAFAAEYDQSFWAWWDRVEGQHEDDPRALLDALLSGIAKWIGRPAFRGCPMLNLATEFPDDDHAGRTVARGNKEELRARLAAIVAKLGVGDPNRVASQMALLINGAYATSAHISWLCSVS
jgi:AcrR family transcriptional regulator